MSDHRIEKDSLGEVKVPKDALWGAQTQRAIENFPVSGVRFPRVFIRALGIIKGAAASANGDLSLLDGNIASAITKAAEEVAGGKLDNHFPLDIFQTGSGTSTNMNANEVIANRANALNPDAGVHPNDHVNMCQSSNDVIPTAIHVSASLLCRDLLIPALKTLRQAAGKRSEELKHSAKTARTHLMDAMPITMGQEIGAWSSQTDDSIARIKSALTRVNRLALGGTAVGTGINAHPEFAGKAIDKISSATDIGFSEAENHFAAQSSMDAATELSAQVKTAATSLMKIANDIRLLGSGPLAGLGEIRLPSLQPGSSIMPGKVNPVICEAAIMACAQAIGNDTAVAIANASGNFQLNTMLPLIAHNLLESITIVGNSASLLAARVIAGFEVNEERLSDSLGQNPILVTSLNPVVGYDKAAEIAKKAYAEGRPVVDVAVEVTGMERDKIERLMDPLRLTEGGIVGD